MRHAIALVLSGGSGDRLSVLSSERAVSAIPFGGKYRVIDFALSNCCHSEIERVGVLTQHAPTSLHDHIGSGRPWDLDRRGVGVRILQPYLTREHAGWYRGTADAVAQNWDLIEASRAVNPPDAPKPSACPFMGRHCRQQSRLADAHFAMHTHGVSRQQGTQHAL